MLDDANTRAGYTTVEADIAAEIELAPQALIDEILALWPALTMAAQEAVYLAVLAYTSFACIY